MYAIYNAYGDLVSVSEQPDVVLDSVLLPPEIDSLTAAIDAGYTVSGVPRQALALKQLSGFSRGRFINKPITDFRKRKVTIIGV